MSFIYLESPNHDPEQYLRKDILNKFSFNFENTIKRGKKLCFFRYPAQKNNYSIFTESNFECEAFYKISMHEHETLFQADVQLQLPLYYIELQDNLIAITTELKFLNLLKTFKLNFISDQNFYASLKNRTNNFCPVKNVIKLSTHNFKLVNLNIIELHNNDNNDKKSHIFKTENDIHQSLTTLFNGYKKEALQLEQPLALSLSGGVDSSIALSVFRKNAQAFTLTTELGDELHKAEQECSFLKHSLIPIEMTQESFEKSILKCIEDGEIFDGLTAEIIGQLHFWVQNLLDNPAFNFEHFITGYGADYIFGSMLDHELFKEYTQCFSQKDFLERISWTLELSPLAFWSLNCRIIHPFWHSSLLNGLKNFPSDILNAKGITKAPLRNWAVKNNHMPQQLAYYKKIGLTEGTQAYKLFASIVKGENHLDYETKNRWVWNKYKQSLMRFQ